MTECSTTSRCRTWWNDAALAVLAGGRGSRLGGVRKGLLLHQGRTLLARTLDDVGRRFAERLVIVASPEEDPEGAALHGPIAEAAGARLVVDQRPGRGAPAGLEAALAEIRAPWLLLLGCDQPFVDPEVIDWQAAARGPLVDAVAIAAGSEKDGRLEPLHAFYHRRALRPLRALLESAQPSLQQLLRELRTVRLEPGRPGAPTAEVAARSLLNVNTLEELSAAGLTLAEAPRPGSP